MFILLVSFLHTKYTTACQLCNQTSPQTLNPQASGLLCRFVNGHKNTQKTMNVNQRRLYPFRCRDHGCYLKAGSNFPSPPFSWQQHAAVGVSLKRRGYRAWTPQPGLRWNQHLVEVKIRDCSFRFGTTPVIVCPQHWNKNEVMKSHPVLASYGTLTTGWSLLWLYG